MPVAFASVSASAAETVLSYRGRLLMPATGNGVRGARNLHFTASGHLPANGQCRSNFKILSVFDGGFSLKAAIAAGFTPSPYNSLKICRDAQSGALSEQLYVNVAVSSNGTLLASYTWSSSDPRRGRAADTVTSFANIEYHVSDAKRVGRLTIDPPK
jgi:hypothetical protein